MHEKWLPDTWESRGKVKHSSPLGFCFPFSWKSLGKWANIKCIFFMTISSPLIIYNYIIALNAFFFYLISYGYNWKIKQTLFYISIQTKLVKGNKVVFPLYFSSITNYRKRIFHFPSLGKDMENYFPSNPFCKPNETESWIFNE